MSSYEEISKQAEADLNTYQAKAGTGRHTDDAGVNSLAENKFEGAEVLTGDDLSTNAGYNKRIPPSEGGIHDDKGRQTRGKDYEGEGGPLDKAVQDGQNDGDVVPGRTTTTTTAGLSSSNDILSQGQAASRQNVGRNPAGPGGSQFKGEDYYVPESVPDSISAEGNVAPASVTEASKESERP